VQRRHLETDGRREGAVCEERMTLRVNCNIFSVSPSSFWTMHVASHVPRH
jgi:hypothetical protein